jgi:hypothetical protein
MWCSRDSQLSPSNAARTRSRARRDAAEDAGSFSEDPITCSAYATPVSAKWSEKSEAPSTNGGRARACARAAAA